MSLLLGIDEGTSAVKAVLFDADLRPVAEARRSTELSRPRPGWVQEDPATVLDAVVEAVGEVLVDAPGEVAACGFDHQGESVLAWDAESGQALTPMVTWQDKRSTEVLDQVRSAGREDEVLDLSGLPLDPYFSAGKIAWLLARDAGVARARDAGTLRIGTVDSFLCDRLGAGFATDPSTASRTQLGAPEWDPRLLEIFGVPLEVLPAIADTASDLGVLRHPRWPVELPLRARCVDQQAALAGAGCVKPGLVKATYGTGVFVLAHVGGARPAPAGGLLPTVAWRIGDQLEWALDGGVFTAGALLNWLSRDLGLWSDAGSLALDAARGLTRDRTLLQLQADAVGVAVARGAVDATVAGAAALAAVGAGVWEPTSEIGDRIGTGECVEPRRGEEWRRGAHAEWRSLVERAAGL